MQANSRNYDDQNVQYAGGFKGFKGVSGASGGRKPFIWYKGYKYTWNETYGDYCCIFKGNGGPVVKKYKEELLKDQLAEAKAAQGAAKPASAESRHSAVNKVADNLANLEIPKDVDAAKKVALDALQAAEDAVKQLQVTEYDLVGAINSAREQINAAQDEQKTGIGKSNIETVLSQLAGRFRACANIIERNAAQNKAEEPKAEEPEKKGEEPKDGGVSIADMTAGEIFQKLSNATNEKEQQFVYSEWAKKFFATKSENDYDKDRAQQLQDFFTNGSVPSFVKRSVLNGVQDLDLFKQNDLSFDTCNNIDDIVDKGTGNRLYLRNWLFERAGGHYMRYFDKSFQNIPAPEVQHRTHYRRYYKIWSMGGASLESLGCLMKEGCAFRDAYDSSREDLVNFMRTHKFRSGTSAEAKEKAKEKIDRYLDVAALSTTTDYEAKGIAYGIRYAIMRAAYEVKKNKMKVAPEDAIIAVLDKYIPESTIKDIASRSPDYQSPPTGETGEKPETPKEEPKTEPKAEPKPKKPRKPREKKPEPETPQEEPKEEPKAEPKKEPPKEEPKSEPKAGPKAEPKVDPKEEPKAEEKPSGPTREGGILDGIKNFRFILNYCFGDNPRPISANMMVKDIVTPIMNALDYAAELVDHPSGAVSENQIESAKKLLDFKKGFPTKEKLASIFLNAGKPNGRPAAQVGIALKNIWARIKKMIPDAAQSYLAPTGADMNTSVSDVAVAMNLKKLQRLQHEVASERPVSAEQVADGFAAFFPKLSNYAGYVLNKIKSEPNPTNDADREKRKKNEELAESIIRTAKTFPTADAWKKWLTEPLEEGDTRMATDLLLEIFDRMVVKTKRLFKIDGGGDYDALSGHFSHLRQQPAPASQKPTEQPKRGRGRPKKQPIYASGGEDEARSKGKGGRPDKDGLTAQDKDFRRRQQEEGIGDWRDVDDDYSTAAFDDLSTEERRAYNNALWHTQTLPKEEEARRQEVLKRIRSLSDDERLIHRLRGEDEVQQIIDSVNAENAKEKEKEKERNSRESNDESAVQYARIRAPKPYVFFDGHKYLWNSKIGDYVWSFHANNHNVLKKLTEAKIEKLKKIMEAKAELEKKADDPISSFDAAKAYQGKRIWMGEDAQTIQDGSVVAVKLRRPATEQQRSTLEELGFSFNEESNGFVKAGEMTDADCDAMKNCNLMFGDEDVSGRNPNHLDQETYATLRARGVINHIPEELRGGVPAREKSQKHGKAEGNVGSSWETFERDGRTYFRSGRAPNEETVKSLKDAGFYYDDIARHWSREGTLEDNEDVLKNLGLRWIEYEDEDLAKKYLGMNLPRTDWKALVTNPDALAEELRNKYIVSNPTRVAEKKEGANETYLDDSPKWDEDVNIALYDAICPPDNIAYNTRDPELVEIPIGDGTLLRFAVFDPAAQSPRIDDGYAFNTWEDLASGMALNLIEELNAIQHGKSYEADDANGTDAYNDPNAGWHSYGNARDGGWGSYASDHGYGYYEDESTEPLPPFEINPIKLNAPNILDVFNKSVYFIDQSTLDKIRKAVPIERDETSNA